MRKLRMGTMILLVALASMSVATGPAAAADPTAASCVAATVAYGTTIAACATATACWVADPATLGLATWACIAATLACLGSIPADATYGAACLDWLQHQAEL